MVIKFDLKVTKTGDNNVIEWRMEVLSEEIEYTDYINGTRL